MVEEYFGQKCSSNRDLCQKYKADEKNKMSTNCDLGGNTAVQLSVIYEIEGTFSVLSKMMLHTKTLHTWSPYCTGEVPKKKKNTHLNIRKVIFLPPYLIWFGAQSVSMNPFGSTSVAGEWYAAVSLMSSPTLSIGLLMSPDLGEADGCLHPSGAEAHGGCLAHTWQSLCRFGEIMGHHASILTSAAHPSQCGAEHGRINDLLGEKKHKEAAQTAQCASIAAQMAKQCTCGAVLKPANCSRQLWPQLYINTFHLIWGFAPACAGNDSR